MTISYKKVAVNTRHSRESFRNIKKIVLKCQNGNAIFAYFRYRYALLQKMKNVLTYQDYIFHFLKKCVPITEIGENPVSVSGFLLKNA